MIQIFARYRINDSTQVATMQLSTDRVIRGRLIAEEIKKRFGEAAQFMDWSCPEPNDQNEPWPTTCFA